MKNNQSQTTDRRGDAIAHHAWMIACYVRGVTDDPARQDAMARNVGDAIVVAVSYQRDNQVEPA